MILGFASLFTLGIIFGFVFVIVAMVAYFGGAADMPTIIGFTVLINFLGWLFSPFFMDLIYRFAYKTKRLEIEDLEKKSARLAKFIKKVCEKHKFKLPKFRHILDDNPTAFTFGSGAFNARLCFSEGLFTYLDEDEIEAVIAHELGHIRRRDFIIMTIASTSVQVLYELSEWLRSRGSKGGSNKKGGLAWAGLLAYVFYIIGTYLLLYLSRVREYGADAFAAQETENPDALSRALVKIAYGIIAKPDEAHQQRLLQSTRALGIFDNKAARNLGTAFESSKNNWNFISKVVAFDLVSPWAKILQLSSTHPLTGRRIEALNKISVKMGKHVSINTEHAISGLHIDKSKLYSGFFSGVFMYFLPWLAPLVPIGAAIAFYNPAHLLWIPAALGAAFLLGILYKYPMLEPEKATTLDMMSDIYASPMRGRLYSLDGKIIGRGVAGAYLSEDLMLQDSTGLIYLNYESAFGFLGNLFFALGKIRKLVGKKAQTVGWFFRDIGHHLDMKEMNCEGSAIKSHPRLWGVIFSFLAIALSVFLVSQGYATVLQGL